MATEGHAVRATVGDLRPKTLDNAKRQFVELYGSALVMNTYLKIALVLVSLVALVNFCQLLHFYVQK